MTKEAPHAEMEEAAEDTGPQEMLEVTESADSIADQAAKNNAETATNSANDSSQELISAKSEAAETFTSRLACTNITETIREVLSPSVSMNKLDEKEAAAMKEISKDSDIRDPNRRIWVVTTAALPWRTGTAVNPLLRALYLTRGRPKHYVTLVVPWLDDEASRLQLYGSDHGFSEGGQKEQEEWIRNYCRTRAQCAEEEENLRIWFYSSVYEKAFGSIFPSEDICSIIPDKEADIAILEEPEHLNWFRVVTKSKKRLRDLSSHATQSAQTNSAEAAETCDSEAVASADKGPNGSDKISEIASETARDKNELGWAKKFRHVLGILHTNYSAYMKQYAVGTSFIAAPALSMLSSIVVRAYCHRLIRLSDALPSLAAQLEVTSNVHGVRSEFLLPPSSMEKPSETTTNPAKVYFIGKVIWAKGFDKVLEVQDMYRNKTGDYFPFDIYGAGPDSQAVERAFHGRTNKQKPNDSEKRELSGDSAAAAAVFQTSGSVRDLVETEMSGISGIEVVPDEDAGDINAVSISAVNSEDNEDDGASRPVSPVGILGNLGSTSISTGLETTQAVFSLAESLVKAGLKLPLEQSRSGESESEKAPSFFFDPPKSKYEWRRSPIPARFLGVKDHVLLRDIPECTIFLNASVTEVLCTTTAEALAMGKFAIIPKHPSNTFFLQFPNCLAYESLSECVEKLEWALANSPVPLTEEYRHRFTWEGATERLFEASVITVGESMKQREDDQATSRIAWLHVESAKKANLIGKMFGGKKKKDSSEEKAVSETNSS